MNNIGKNVDSMNFEELRSFVKVLANNVQELSDLYAKTKREYNDMLYNLSRDNLSIEYIQEEREFVNSTVGNKMKDYSTIEQTEDMIKATVESTKEYVDKKLGDVVLDEYTTVEQTAESIKTIAAKQVNLKDAIEVEEITNQLYENYIYKICEYADEKKTIVTAETYYYYNELGNEWIPFQAENLYTVFQQTAEGFLFKGNVIIDGDAVVTKNLKAQKIVSQDGNEIALLTMVSNGESKFPDLTYYGKIEDNYQELFGIRYDGAGTSYIRLNGINIGYVGINKEKFYPLGTWCFSEKNGTEVEGLGVVPVFGG